MCFFVAGNLLLNLTDQVGKSRVGFPSGQYTELWQRASAACSISPPSAAVFLYTWRFLAITFNLLSELEIFIVPSMVNFVHSTPHIFPSGRNSMMQFSQLFSTTWWVTNSSGKFGRMDRHQEFWLWCHYSMREHRGGTVQVRSAGIIKDQNVALPHDHHVWERRTRTFSSVKPRRTRIFITTTGKVLQCRETADISRLVSSWSDIGSGCTGLNHKT